MLALLLNMIWPASFVVSEMEVFWYLVFGTIIIETILVKLILKVPWYRAGLMSVVGNCISGFVGTQLMWIGMLFWHLLVDWFVAETFNPFNWVMTFVLMCAGSVWLEAKTIRVLFKADKGLVFRAMAIGNILSYIFIAVQMFIVHDDLAYIMKRWS